MSRPRLTIGTYGEITTRRRPSGRIEARARYRDWDGATRLVQARSRLTARSLIWSRTGSKISSWRIGSQRPPGNCMNAICARSYCPHSRI